MRLEFRSYERRFRVPLITAHGRWDKREGLILRLEDDAGNIGYGECAPLTAFGTESLEQASERLRGISSDPDKADVDLDALENTMPCLRSAFDMALRSLQRLDFPTGGRLPAAALLPAGYAAIKELERLLEAGYRHFKWKVGRDPIKENTVFLQLMRLLPEDARLRVDANGAFDRDQARQWLRYMEGRRVECFEQPMSADSLEEMRLLSHEFDTPIALDESVRSVAEMERLCASGWKGYLVVKPAIMGALLPFLHMREKYRPRLIYSTAFETSIGLQYLIELAASDPQNPLPAVGLGGESMFERDGFCLHEFGASVGVWRYRSEDFDAIWERLPQA